MTTFEDIRYEVDGPAAVITINRPERRRRRLGQEPLARVLSADC